MSNLIRSVPLVLILAIGAPAASISQPAATPPATDIYLISLGHRSLGGGGLTGGLASMKTAKPTPLSVVAGYDNQPMFSPDGGRILFAANRDGKQIDIYVFERSSGAVSRLTETAENENSPTYLPAGVGGPGDFSVVRTEPDKTQRLWRFDARGRNPQLVLAGVKPIGYHAWVTAGTLALFVLGPPATLRIASVTTGQAEIVADNIGRSLHRIPGTPHVSFVQRHNSGEFWVKQLEVASKRIEPLIKAVEGSADRDMTWMPDGKTILMSAGPKVFSWTRGGARWAEVFDAAAHSLGAVSRLAVSPTGDAVAIVVAEAGR